MDFSFSFSFELIWRASFSGIFSFSFSVLSASWKFLEEQMMERSFIVIWLTRSFAFYQLERRGAFWQLLIFVFVLFFDFLFRLNAEQKLWSMNTKHLQDIESRANAPQVDQLHNRRKGKNEKKIVFHSLHNWMNQKVFLKRKKNTEKDLNGKSYGKFSCFWRKFMQKKNGKSFGRI